MRNRAGTTESLRKKNHGIYQPLPFATQYASPRRLTIYDSLSQPHYLIDTGAEASVMRASRNHRPPYLWLQTTRRRVISRNSFILLAFPSSRHPEVILLRKEKVVAITRTLYTYAIP